MMFILVAAIQAHTGARSICIPAVHILHCPSHLKAGPSSSWHILLLFMLQLYLPVANLHITNPSCMSHLADALPQSAYTGQKNHASQCPQQGCVACRSVSLANSQTSSWCALQMHILYSMTDRCLRP